ESQEVIYIRATDPFVFVGFQQFQQFLCLPARNTGDVRNIACMRFQKTAWTQGIKDELHGPLPPAGKRAVEMGEQFGKNARGAFGCGLNDSEWYFLFIYLYQWFFFAFIFNVLAQFVSIIFKNADGIINEIIQ